MPSDFLALVHRDHSELQLQLAQLLDRASTAVELSLALDGVRLCLTAHIEAEDIVLTAFERVPSLAGAIAQARAAHLAQERALSLLVSARPQTEAWRGHAEHLRDLVATHSAHEETHLLPALREYEPERYARLAGDFATERLRQLAMLQPSAPFEMPAFAG